MVKGDRDVFIHQGGGSVVTEVEGERWIAVWRGERHAVSVVRVGDVSNPGDKHAVVVSNRDTFGSKQGPVEEHIVRFACVVPRGEVGLAVGFEHTKIGSLGVGVDLVLFHIADTSVQDRHQHAVTGETCIVTRVVAPLDVHGFI